MEALLAQMPFAAVWRALDLDRLAADDVAGRLGGDMRTRAARDDLDGVFAGLFGRDWRKRLCAVASAARP